MKKTNLKLLIVTLAFLLSAVAFYNLQSNYLPTKYIVKFDRHQIINKETSKDNLLKAIQFNVKIKESQIPKDGIFYVTIKNNKSKIRYNFFKDGENYKYKIKNAFNQESYIENSWYNCVGEHCFFAVQYYPDYYSHDEVKNKFTINTMGKSENVYIDIKNSFSKWKINKIRNKNKFSMSVDKNDVTITLQKGTFSNDASGFSVILEYQIFGSKNRKHMAIEDKSLFEKGYYKATIPYEENELQYLSVFIYDEYNNYENKIVIIGR